MRKVRRPDTTRPFVFDSRTVARESFDNLVHLAGIPGQNDVLQQGIRAGHRRQFVTAPAALGRESTAMAVVGPVRQASKWGSGQEPAWMLGIGRNRTNLHDKHDYPQTLKRSGAA